MFSETTAFRKIDALKKRVRIIQGGTSASKTISILLKLIGLAQTDYTCRKCGTKGCQDKAHTAQWVMEPTLTSITSESVPHLKRGAIRDFKKIMKSHGYWKDSCWNATDSIYTFETGSQIEFFSTDNGDKLRGGRRDRGFMNEANNCTFDAFEQLEVRTTEFFIIDFNPSVEFWAHLEVMGKRDDVDFLILTYKDNEALRPEIVASIEQRKNRKGWWQVYGLGQLGEVEGKIYKDWQIIDTVPHEARLVRRALDFGYSNDPAALVDIYYYNGGYIFDQQLYRKGMLNKPIADFITNLDEPQTLVIADSAEPKSIAELQGYGINILPADKGQDSIRNGIATVQAQRISMTKRSVDLIREYRQYMWRFDRDGRQLTEPEEGNDHALDAVRYGIVSLTTDVEDDFDYDAFEEEELSTSDMIHDEIGV